MLPLAQTLRHIGGAILRVPWPVWAGGGAVLLLGGTALAAVGGSTPAEQSGPMPTVQLGTSGPAVSAWQKVLGLSQTGVFDAATDAAARAWQAAHGLTADGVVGPDTWGAAGFPTAPRMPAPPSGGGIGPGLPAPPPATPSGDNPFGLADDRAGREAQILAYVQAGQIDHEWAPLTWTKNGRTVTVDVSRRALALWDGSNRLPVSASFTTAQQIADMLGAMMLTTRIADEIARQAPTKIAPLTRSWDTDHPVTGMSTARMLEQGAAIDDRVAGAPGLVANEGKDWVVTRRFWLPPAGLGELGKLHRSANFGLHVASSSSHSPGGMPVLQSIGLAHEEPFVDYSQLLRFARLGSLTIDGEPHDLADALGDPALSALLQDEGDTLPGIRHPDL